MTDKSSQQTADAIFLLDALQHVTSTVVINAGEIAAQKDAKVNTIQKRFTTLKQRYNLNIQTTAVGSAATATPTRARAAKVTKTPTPKKTAAKKTNAAKAAAIAEQLEEEKSDEGNVKTEDGDEEMRNAEQSEDDSDRV